MTAIQHAYTYKTTSMESLIAEYTHYLSRLRGENENSTPTVTEAKSAFAKNTAESITSLIKKLARESSCLIAANASDKDVESYMTLLLTVFKLLGEKAAKAEDECINLMVQSIVEDKTERGTLKLKLLTIIYNTLIPTSPLRYEIFINVIKVASSHNDLSILISQIPHLPSFLTQWSSTPAKARALYSLFAKSLQSAGHTAEAFSLYLMYLRTFEKGNEKDANVKDVVVKTIVLGLNEESVLELDELWRLKAVQTLRSEKIVEMLKIVVLDNLSTFKSFVKGNQLALESLGLNLHSLLHKMTLLTLASTAALFVNTATPMTYAKIAETLEIPETDVEFWVIEALKKGIIGGRINQVEKNVCVSRTTHRTLNLTEWKSLSSRLHAWKSSLSEIHTVIENSKDGCNQFNQNQLSQITA